jgi:hypothetical protein
MIACMQLHAAHHDSEGQVAQEYRSMGVIGGPRGRAGLGGRGGGQVHSDMMTFHLEVTGLRAQVLHLSTVSPCKVLFLTTKPEVPC